MSKAWKKRKRICQDMMETVLESYPKPKRVFLEEADVTLDEESDKIPTY